jgi:hypothetical protein
MVHPRYTPDTPGGPQKTFGISGSWERQLVLFIDVGRAYVVTRTAFTRTPRKYVEKYALVPQSPTHGCSLAEVISY